MKQCLYSCYCLVFSYWLRLVNAKVVLYVLAIGILMGLHLLMGTHAPVFYADSDPWNG